MRLFVRVGALAVLILSLTQSFAFGQTRTDETRESMPGELARREAIEFQRASGRTPTQLLNEWRSKEFRPTLQFPIATPTYAWDFLGPQNQSGRILTISAIPGTSQLLAGSSGGGIWKFARDGNWHNKTDNFPSLKMTASAVSHVDPSIAMMGTREGFLYVSIDSGESWSVLNTAPGANVASIAFHPKLRNTCLVATDDGLMITTDLGSTWSVLAQGRAKNIWIDADHPEVIYYGRMGATKPYAKTSIMRSTDGGKTFNSILDFSTGYYSNALYSVCKSQPNVIWAASDSSFTIMRSIDTGLTWKVCGSSPLLSSNDNLLYTLNADPNDPLSVACGGIGLNFSNDAGESWYTNDDGVLHADIRAVAFTGGMNAVVAGDGGVFVTSNYLDYIISWKYIGQGLVTLEAYNVTGSPDSTDIIIAGNQDNAYVKYSHSKTNWLTTTGDGFVGIYDPRNPKTFYHEYTLMNIHKSSDGFTQWGAKAMRGLPTTAQPFDGITPDTVDWYGQALTMDPRNSSRLYCGTSKLYQTKDGATNWSLASFTKLSRGGAITAIAVNPLDSMKMIVGSEDGLVSVSRDQGFTWDSISSNQFGGQFTKVYSIVYDPKHPLKVYLSLRIDPGGTPIYRSVDGGKHWEAASAGLPQGFTSRLLVDSRNPDTLYVGTMNGVYVSLDRGTNWNVLSGLPNVEVRDLAWEMLKDSVGVTSRCLLVATYGRGIVRGLPPIILATQPDTIRMRSSVIGQNNDTIVSPIYTNFGQTSVTISGLRWIGQDSDGFSFLSIPKSVTLRSGESYVLPVRFLAAAQRVFSATLSFKPSTIATTTLIQFTAAGNRPVLTANASRIDFGSVAAGAAQDTLTTLSAAGLTTSFDSVHVDSTFIMGPNASDFSLTTASSPFALSSSDTKQLSFRFSPRVPGLELAYVVIASDDIRKRDTIFLSGFSVGHLDTLRFRTVRIGTVEDSVFELAYRNDGSQTLSIQDVQLDGVDNAYFSVLSGGGSFVLRPSQSRAIALRFSPLGSKLYKAAIILKRSGSESPIMIPIEAVATAPEIQLVAHAIDFGNIHSTPERDSIVSFGAAGLPSTKDSLHILSISIVGSQASDFSVTSGNTPYAITGTDSVNLLFRFQPHSIGKETALCIITSDGIRTSDTILLSGYSEKSGIEPIADLRASQISLRCAPNPIHNTGTIWINSIKSLVGKAYDARLLDMLGREVVAWKRGSILSPRSRLELAAAQVPSGLYEFEVRVGEVVARQEIIVNH
jgi:photosystem II stability/assembly factor-like uncharacterized protein